MEVFGSSPKATASGHLKCARRARQKSMISSALVSRAVLEGHERHRALAPALVGHRHHRALEDRRVAADHLLDLDRGDVLAPRDHHVLDAIAQLDVAVGVPDGHVAGVEPASAERLLGGLRVLVVAAHHRVAAGDDLAERGAVPRHVVHLRVHDPDRIGQQVAVALARLQS